MAFLRMLSGSLEVAGHGVAVGATALADVVTAGGVPEVHNARRDQERRLHAAARGVGENARVVGNDVGRAVDTAGASVGVLARVITDVDQLRRLKELIETYDLAGFLRALAPGGRLPPGFFPAWIRRAGGYFPKLAQVLAVRADLIRDPEVLAQLARCLEDMPMRPPEAVRELLLQQGWAEDVCNGVGQGLSAGSVAQVNLLTLPDMRTGVVKVAWPDTRRQMQIDFRLFAHAQSILSALRFQDERSQSVAAMFAAVGKSEAAVMREFDMCEEARYLRIAGELCQASGEWESAYCGVWLPAADTALARLPWPLGDIAGVLVRRAGASGCRVAAPSPLEGLCCSSALAMSRAGGDSLHALLTSTVEETRREATAVLIARAVPFIGWLLCCKSASHLAHVDPHPGNFRWCAESQTLWVLDWGSCVKFSDERRRALCLLVLLLAGGEGDDGAIADTARTFGIRGADSRLLAQLLRGMMNVTPNHAAREALNSASVDKILSDVDDSVVPVVRCLATLGGTMQEVQRRLRSELQQNVPLSLAAMWQPFAAMGLSP